MSPSPIARKPAPRILIAEADMPVKARAPVAPASAEDDGPVDPELPARPLVELDPVDPPPELAELAEDGATVLDVVLVPPVDVVVDVDELVEVVVLVVEVLEEVVVVDGSVVVVAGSVVVVVGGSVVLVVVVAGSVVVVDDSVVVVGGSVVVGSVVGGSVVVVVAGELGGPGTADQTNPLGSGVLFVKVISVFQLSVSTPAPVTQAMPPSQTPLVPPGPSSRAERMLKLVTPGPHSRSLGRVGTTSLEATGMLSMGAAVLSRKPYPVEMVLLAKVRPWMFVPWGTR
jgi:hypothetical protein